jgi:hypothetical protein
MKQRLSLTQVTGAQTGVMLSPCGTTAGLQVAPPSLDVAATAWTSLLLPKLPGTPIATQWLTVGQLTACIAAPAGNAEAVT